MWVEQVGEAPDVLLIRGLGSRERLHLIPAKEQGALDMPVARRFRRLELELRPGQLSASEIGVRDRDSQLPDVLARREQPRGRCAKRGLCELTDRNDRGSTGFSRSRSYRGRALINMVEHRAAAVGSDRGRPVGQRP